jgi:hypothetical protein
MLSKFEKMRPGPRFAYDNVDQFMEARNNVIDMAMAHGKAIKVSDRTMKAGCRTVRL